MKSFSTIRSILFILSLAFVIFLNGCQSDFGTNTNAVKTNDNTSSPKENVTTASDRIEDLLELIRLPELPEEVVWQEDADANPKKLTAVLRFDAETLPKFTALIEQKKQADSVEIGLENWFPEELTAQAQLSGAEIIKGTAYNANDFFNQPFGNGRIVRIEGTDFFVLELFVSQ